MNLGWTEILLVGGIALLLFGPTKLPGLGRSLGESIRGFKKALTEEPQDERPVEREQVARKTETPLNQTEVKTDLTETEKDAEKKS